MLLPDENNSGFLDNINKLASTGLNIVSLINGIRGIGTDNPYYYPQTTINYPQPNRQFPQQDVYPRYDIEQILSQQKKSNYMQ